MEMANNTADLRL